MINDEQILRLYAGTDGEFYLFDLDAFRLNLRQFTSAFSQRHSNFKLAYSYKTNYVPRICEVAHEEGALAEVVSSFEYELAVANGLDPSQIIVNGPIHGREFLERVLLEGAQLNVDGFSALNNVIEICLDHSNKDFTIGLRVNFKNDDSPLSRFGFFNSPQNFLHIKQKIDSTPNLAVTALHCHFSTALRSQRSFESRTEKLIDVYLHEFSGQPVKYVNIGGGFFSKMPRSLQNQFGTVIPDYDDYAEVICNAVHKSLPEGRDTTLIAEPGTALVADAGRFICPVVETKRVASRNIALVCGSVHNIKPTLNTKNLPFRVISTRERKKPEKIF